MQVTEETLDRIINMVSKGYEVHITVEPERTEIEIMPWKPFEYACPYEKK